MSGKRWLVVGVLALVILVLMGVMAVVVFRSFSPLSSAPEPTFTTAPTLGPTELPAATYPPTWTPTSQPAVVSTRTPKATGTPTLSPTPFPTATPSATPTPEPAPLENPTFDDVLVDMIPGWKTGATANWAPGQDFDTASSFGAPRFHQADDARQWINGPTLQIDTVDWVKLRAWVYQTAAVTPGSRVQFQVSAMGFLYDTTGGYILKAGVDPSGSDGCGGARWSEERIANQNDGVIILTSPRVTAGEGGEVTVCMFAETQFAQVYHAAFFDDAELMVSPPAGE